MGLTPGEVGLLYVLELTAVAAVAAGLGLAIAYVAAPVMLAPTANLLHTAPVVTLPLGGVLTVFGVVVLLAAASSLVPAALAARLATVPALTDTGRRPPRPSRIAHAERFGVPLGVRTGLGDAFSRPIRAWLTVLAIGTLGASAVATLTFEATISGFVSQPARVGISPFDLVVSAAGGDRASTLAGVTALAAARDDVRAIVYRSVWWLNLPTDGIRLDSTSDRYERVLTRALSGDIAGSGIPVVSGRLPAAPGEVAVGIGLARRFGIHDGDRLPTTFVGDSTQLPLPLRVVGTIADASNDARVLLVTADTFAGVAGASAVPDEIAWRLDSPASVASVRTAISNAFGASVQIDESRAHLLADITATRDDLRPVLFGLNGLLFAIAALNLLLILVISVRERRRELATLRALGFTPRQLGVGVLASAGLLGAAGVAVGAPTGYALVRWLLDGVAHDAGWQAGAVATPGPLAWRLLVGVAIAVAVAAAAVPAWLAIRGPVADGMRAE